MGTLHVCIYIVCAPPQLAHEVLLLLLLSDLESLPRLVDVRDEASLRGNVGRPVAQAKLCLKGVEVGLQAALLLGLRGLGDSGILTELFETALSILEGVLRHTVFEPWHRLSNPFKQLKRRKERERERERERDELMGTR